MDEEGFKKLTSFIIRARKVTGTIDSKRLLTDEEYAISIFQKVDEVGDADLIILALQLRQVMSAEAPTVLNGKDGKGGKKYMYGARG